MLVTQKPLLEGGIRCVHQYSVVVASRSWLINMLERYYKTLQYEDNKACLIECVRGCVAALNMYKLIN